MNHHEMKLHGNPEPSEIWGLWATGSGGRIGPHWVVSMLETGDPIIVYLSESEAIAGAKYHLDAYGVVCEPKQIAPLEQVRTGPTEEALGEIVKLLSASIQLNEMLLHLPILEHQRGKLNQLHTHLCGIVGELGQRANSVAFKGQPDPRPAKVPSIPKLDVPRLVNACTRMLEVDFGEEESAAMREISEILTAGGVEIFEPDGLVHDNEEDSPFAVGQRVKPKRGDWGGLPAAIIEIQWDEECGGWFADLAFDNGSRNSFLSSDLVALPPAAADAVVDADGWDGTASGEGGEGGAT